MARPAKKPDQAAHVFAGDKGRLACLHCGANYTPAMPCDIDIVIAIWAAFDKKHRRCAKPDRERCGVCLEIGHATEQHVYRDYHAWLGGGDTGTSSRAIWHFMRGNPVPAEGGPPHDPSDFGRCHRLLAAFPEWRSRIREMKDLPGWAGIVGAWDELEVLYLEELPSGTAPKLYGRMKMLTRGR